VEKYLVGLHPDSIPPVEFLFEIFQAQPMSRILVIKPILDLPMVAWVVLVAQMKQICSHLVLLLPRQGSQLVLDFLNAHNPLLEASYCLRKAP
jgi:hypothetical protein